jgi:hypothetical protein
VTAVAHREEQIAQVIPARVGLPARAGINQALDILAAHKDAWAQMDIAGRIALLDRMHDDLVKVEQRWVDASLLAKGNRHETMAEGEEWYSITTVYRQIRFLRKALQDIAQAGKPRIPGKVYTNSRGQVAAQVIPYDGQERLIFLLLGIHAEVWMDPAVSLSEGIPQASFYRQQNRQGHVCLVLGAGNVSTLIPQDFLYKLFVEGCVVAVKMNPVNDYLGPIFEEGFASLIDAGFLRILYGGTAEGEYLCNHPVVESVHLTGSDRTYDAIVFGTGDEGRERKLQCRPRFTKPFSAELGNISPVIIVPGPWSDKDVLQQAERMGSWVVPNAAHNCLTPRMLIQMKGSPQREKLNGAIADFLSSIETRKAYYPGSHALHQQFVEVHPEAQKLGAPAKGHLPWTLITDVDPSNHDDICFTREPFFSLYSETALEANDVVDYIEKAVTFANERLWGNLVASIVVHPDSLKDPAIAAAVEQAIADLRYGSVVVNHWGALAHFMMITPWGAYPGNPPHNIQSGAGFVNNPLMFDQPQKSVVRAFFNPLINPFLVNLSNSYLFYRENTRFHHDLSVANLLKLMWRALTVKKMTAR